MLLTAHRRGREAREGQDRRARGDPETGKERRPPHREKSQHRCKRRRENAGKPRRQQLKPRAAVRRRERERHDHTDGQSTCRGRGREGQHRSGKRKRLAECVRAEGQSDTQSSEDRQAEERGREEEQRRRPQEYVADDERRENETTCAERRDHEAHGNVGDEQYDDLSPRRMKPRAPGREYADARGREAHVPSTETGQDRKRRHCRGPGEGERPCTHRIGCDRLMCRDEQRDRSTEKQQNRRDEGRPRADEDGDRERAGRGSEQKQPRDPQRRRCRHAGIVPRDLA